MGHWDHLGVDTNLEGDQIHNGAVDNATGTAAVMHMAEIFAKKQPKRSIAFIGANRRGVRPVGLCLSC